MTFYYFALSYVNDLSSRRRRASPRSSRWRRCSWTRSSAAQSQPYQFLTNNSTSTLPPNILTHETLFSCQLFISCSFFWFQFFILILSSWNMFCIGLYKKNIYSFQLSKKEKIGCEFLIFVSNDGQEVKH